MTRPKIDPMPSSFTKSPTADNRSVIIYTDGACSGNPGPGGWGAVIKCGETRKEISGYADATTNNRMELTAVIEAFQDLAPGQDIAIYTDSTYVRDGICRWMEKWQRNGWRTAAKKAVKNKDLWIRLKQAADHHRVQWHWVKGHSDNYDNERADALATQAIRSVLA